MTLSLDLVNLVLAVAVVLAVSTAILAFGPPLTDFVRGLLSPRLDEYIEELGYKAENGQPIDRAEVEKLTSLLNDRRYARSGDRRAAIRLIIEAAKRNRPGGGSDNGAGHGATGHEMPSHADPNRSGGPGSSGGSGPESAGSPDRGSTTATLTRRANAAADPEVVAELRAQWVNGIAEATVPGATSDHELLTRLAAEESDEDLAEFWRQAADLSGRGTTSPRLLNGVNECVALIAEHARDVQTVRRKLLEVSGIYESAGSEGAPLHGRVARLVDDITVVTEHPHVFRDSGDRSVVILPALRFPLLRILDTQVHLEIIGLFLLVDAQSEWADIISRVWSRTYHHGREGANVFRNPTSGIVASLVRTGLEGLPPISDAPSPREWIVAAGFASTSFEDEVLSKVIPFPSRRTDTTSPSGRAAIEG